MYIPIITDYAKVYSQMEEKISIIHNLSGLTLDDIIDKLAKGYEFVPPKAEETLTMADVDLLDIIDKVTNTLVPKEVVYGLGSLEQREAGISNKHVIQYFKNDDSVTLIDEKGRKWRKGERVYD